MRSGFAAGLVLLTSVLAFATLGVFRGKLVQPPAQQSRVGWIFVQSPKGMLRQVEISRAKVLYSDDVPMAHRSSHPAADLVPGAEVLVTAEQDTAGEWRATEIEILSLGASRASGAHRRQRQAGLQ